MGRRVWFYEIWKFLLADRHVKEGPTLGEFWNREVDGEESMRRPRGRSLPLPVRENSCGSSCGQVSEAAEATEASTDSASVRHSLGSVRTVTQIGQS